MANKLTKGKRKFLIDIYNFKVGILYPGQLFYLGGYLKKLNYPTFVEKSEHNSSQIYTFELDFFGNPFSREDV